MRSMTRLFALAGGLVLASPLVAAAWMGPHPVTNNYHNPQDLSATVSLAPKPWVQNRQPFVVAPPRPLDPSLLVAGVPAWPTLDLPEWIRYRQSYAITMRVNRFDPGWIPRVPTDWPTR